MCRPGRRGRNFPRLVPRRDSGAGAEDSLRTGRTERLVANWVDARRRWKLSRPSPKVVKTEYRTTTWLQRAVIQSATGVHSTVTLGGSPKQRRVADVRAPVLSWRARPARRVFFRERRTRDRSACAQRTPTSQERCCLDHVAGTNDSDPFSRFFFAPRRDAAARAS